MIYASLTYTPQTNGGKPPANAHGRQSAKLRRRPQKGERLYRLRPLHKTNVTVKAPVNLPGYRRSYLRPIRARPTLAPCPKTSHHHHRHRTKPTKSANR